MRKLLAASIIHFILRIGMGRGSVGNLEFRIPRLESALLCLFITACSVDTQMPTSTDNPEHKAVDLAVDNNTNSGVSNNDTSSAPQIKEYGSVIKESLTNNNVKTEANKGKAIIDIANKDPELDLYNDDYVKIAQLIKDKKYPDAEELLKKLGALDPDMEYLHMLVLDRLGDHDKPLQYWRDKIDNYLKAKGLYIDTLEFCRKIYGSGRYDKIDSIEFAPGSAILLYVGMKNIVFKKINEGYQLRLQYNWELYDSTNKKLPIWDNTPLSARIDELIYQQKISDYYQSFLLPLPKNIAGGDYKLKVSVKDLETMSESSIEKSLKIIFIN